MCDEVCANDHFAYIKLERNIIYDEFALSKFENLLIEQATQLDKRLTSDKCARKHICGHFCGMEGNNA